MARVHLGIFNPEPQPIFNEDKSLFIFMDGKIYDYDKEKGELKLKGHKFIYENDPEFCIRSYDQYGIDFVEKLNGSFVFIICNLKENKMTIANDRYGLRPLYYALNGNQLLFSSEVKSILEDKSFKELDDEAVADFFAFKRILGNKTFVKGIKILPPATIAVYDGHNLSIRQYWDFDYKPDCAPMRKLHIKFTTPTHNEYTLTHSFITKGVMGERFPPSLKR
jgi:asparagine synthase (glutamine-hydrolysing)